MTFANVCFMQDAFCQDSSITVTSFGTCPVTGALTPRAFGPRFHHSEPESEPESESSEVEERLAPGRWSTSQVGHVEPGAEGALAHRRQPLLPRGLPPV